MYIMALSVLRHNFQRFAFNCIKYEMQKCRNIHTSHPNLVYRTSFLSKRRKSAEERKSPRIIEYSPKSKRTENVVGIWRNMTVAELASVMNKDIDHVFNVMLHVKNTNHLTRPESIVDDPQTVYEILKKSGFRYKIISRPDDTDDNKTEQNIDITRQPPNPTNYVRRSPVVTIMGHVDHGKTTLLDSLRNTSVVSTEFGGITQHIGAFSVQLKSGDKITFLDTPGHAAFSAMRNRGAHVTDLVVLVVAADDGVMTQTIESIKMAKSANVPILVAINKIDKPAADIERTKKMLMQHGIQVEDFGGDVQAIPISALKGTNLDILTEAIVLQADIMDLKGDPKSLVAGVIIESKTDPRRGKLSTSIVQQGTLRKGTILVAGCAWAKVRAMFNHDGQPMNKATPSMPVEIIGWRELPSAGDEMLEVLSEKQAHNVIKYRESKKLEEKQLSDAVIVQQKMNEHLTAYRAQLEHKRRMGKFRLKPSGPRQKQIQDEDTSIPRVNIIVKGDVDGSVEAILDVIETYDCQNICKLDLIHYGVGNITETDIELGETFNAIIYGFNVDCPPNILPLAKEKNVLFKKHNVIYKLIDDLKEIISGKIKPKDQEEILGEANVLQQFMITEGRKKIPVAGCRCTKGILKKSAMYRLMRGNEVIHEGTLESMRHLKNEVDTIKNDNECGLQLKDKTIEFKPGDTLICYKINHVPQTVAWDPGF